MSMERRNPRNFSLDDRRVYDAYIAGRMSAALAVGVRSGLFDLLEEAPLSIPEIARRLKFSERPVRSLLAALVAMHLVHRDDARSPATFSLSPDAAAYLVRGKPGWLGGLIDLEIEHFLSPRALLDALRKDTASVYGADDPWEHHEEDVEAARRFTRAMHSVSERPAAGVSEVVDFAGVSSLLDVGGGSGALSLAIARAWPKVRCVIWDLPVVCTFAREYAKDAGLQDRVTAEPGDMFKEEFPRGHDAILFSQILHDWQPEKGRVLLRKAKGALSTGGRVLIHEKLVDEDGRGPLANALVHLDMLVWTEGQQFTEQELREMLGEAGFGGIERKPTAGYWSIIEARA
jgi:SAM-dependent methyltransferase